MRNKRLINNRKGFTLVELLGVIVIIGVMMGIAIPTISFIVKKTREKYYSEQTQLMVEAAQTYFDDNKDKMPKEIGQSKIVYLNDLYNGKYIKEKIKDKAGNTCYYKEDNTKIKNSYVKIYKYNKNDYSYEGYLNCPSCEGDKCETKDDGKKPVITFTQDPSSLEDSNFIDATLNINLKGNTSNLNSYSYKIYTNGLLVKNSGIKTTNEDPKDITIKLGEYLPSKFKIVVTATNQQGNTASQTKVIDEPNLKAVQVGDRLYTGGLEKNASSCGNKWIKEGQTRTVTVQCKSSKGTGCAQEEFKKTFTNKSTNNEGIDYVPMKDSKGKSFNAKVYTCIDGTKPTITFKVKKDNSSGSTVSIDSSNTTSWINSNAYVEAVVNDSQSKVTEIKWEENKSGYFTTNENYSVVNPKINQNGSYIESANNTLTADGIRKIRVTATDAVGNTITETLTVKIDKTPPVCGSFSGASYWSNSGNTVRVGCSDSGIGCSQSSFSKYVTTEGRATNVSIEISDKAGNKITCPGYVNVLIDRTAPSCGSWSGESYSWATSRTLSVGCSDYSSGCYQSYFSKTITSGGRTANVSIQIEDNAGNTRTCSKTSAAVYIDNVPPTCGSWSGGSTTWTKNNRTISVGCSDSETGCSSSTFSTTVSTEGKTASVSIGIRDNAGNTRTCTNTSVNTYIDKTPPYFISSSKSLDKSVHYGAHFSAKFGDDLSGLKPVSGSQFQYCYVKTNCTNIDDRWCKVGWTNATIGENGSNLSSGAKTGTIKSATSSNCSPGYTTRSKYKVYDQAGNYTEKQLSWSW